MSRLYACTSRMISRLPHSYWSLLLRRSWSHCETPLTLSTPTSHCHTGVKKKKVRGGGAGHASMKYPDIVSKSNPFTWNLSHSTSSNPPYQHHSFALPADVTTHPSFVSLLTFSPSSPPCALSFLPPPLYASPRLPSTPTPFPLVTVLWAC